ncbi:hypothetical protein kam1_186 [Methylacidiphilum kamchatkense Kam1]|uniref:Sodium:solute symporter family protein n=2 Tax=Methylacidiphilum kamchatkense TaxID=431057 RepID=A0A516TJK8_9BACT|nr:hypothetical protein kam1_186 [Methylacidiphilum kamchatkense Kam1]
MILFHVTVYFRHFELQRKTENELMSTSLWLDGLVIVFFLSLIFWIGLFSSKDGQEKKYDDLTLGGRKMPWWSILGSIIAAETSAGAFLGTPAEGYVLQNYTYLQLALGTILARLIIAFFLSSLSFN